MRNIDNNTNIDDINADFLLSFDIKLIIIPKINELNDISIKYNINNNGCYIAYSTLKHNDNIKVIMLADMIIII